MPRAKSVNTDHLGVDALWADSFSRAIRKKTKEPSGTGWLTMVEIKRKAAICLWKTKAFVAEEIKAGRMECFSGIALAKNDQPRTQRWYRPVLPALAGKR